MSEWLLQQGVSTDSTAVTDTFLQYGVLGVLALLLLGGIVWVVRYLLAFMRETLSGERERTGAVVSAIQESTTTNKALTGAVENLDTSVQQLEKRLQSMEHKLDRGGR